MEHFPPVDILQSQAHLNKPVHYLSFREKISLGLPFLDMEGKIAHLAELHYNYQDSFIYESSLIANYIGMGQVFQEVGL